MRQITSTPQLGSVSKDTALLQEALNEWLIANKPDYTPLKVDGVFGPATKAVVVLVQDKLKTGSSGIIGPITLAELSLQVVATSPVTGRVTVTQDLPGKKQRHIHPSLRLAIEAIVFPGGVVGDCWKKSNIAECYIAVARGLAKLAIAETGGNNKGERVGWLQATTRTDKAAKGGTGDPWCEDYAQVIYALIEDYFQIESPVVSSPGTQFVWGEAKKVKGLTTLIPTAGAQAIGKKTSSSGHAMPCVTILSDKLMLTSEGNTSIGNMTDGDGSGLKQRNIWKNGTLKTLGWVFTYPNNVLPTAN